jgi:predicted dehydrogenase
MSERLRLGLIGAGSWAVASHLPNFEARRDQVEFAAVARKDPGLLQRIQRRYGFERASEDYRDVVEAGIDICVVASPPRFHHEHAKAALEAGAHVLVEKPFTLDPRDAWDLVDTSRRVSRHVVVAFGWNYRPMVRQARGLLLEHGVGEVEQVTIAMASSTRELLATAGAYADSAVDLPPDGATWTDPAVSGGGYGQAQLSHALGLALWLTELRGAEVFALMSRPGGAPVELHDAISLRFDNGAIGTLAGGSCHARANGDKHQLQVRVIGSEGQALVDVEREAVWIWSNGGEVDIQAELSPGAGAYDCDGPPNTLIDLALGLSEANESPGELGARTVEILDAAYRSAASGRLEPVLGRDARA